MNDGDEPRQTTIRSYAKGDRAQVRHIAFLTAFLERPAEFFDDEEVLADILTLYFTDYEPGSSFVATTADGTVVGYLTGARDTRRMERISLSRLAPRILWKSVRRGILVQEKILLFIWHLFLSVCRGEFISRDFSREYPATFHINILSDFRGRGIGERLVEAYCEYLHRENIPGVRVSTFSERAKHFFNKVGLSVLSQGSRNFLRYRIGRDTTGYILGKKLS